MATFSFSSMEGSSRGGADGRVAGGSSDYSGLGVAVSLLRVVAVGLVGLSLGSVAAVGQYPGRITTTDKEKKEPVLRSVAVVEWTGDAGKPSASRVIPVSVFDGEQLNDGTIYLSRPEPMALAGGVEYELQTAGKPTGIFDVFGAGDVNGAWQGVGVWKPLSAADVAKAKGAFNQSSLMNGDTSVDLPEDDKPVLKRKHPKGTDTDDGDSAKSSSGASGTDTSAKKSSGGEDDPDRPKLKRKDAGAGAGSSGAGNSGTAGPDTASGGKGSTDPDRPTIRRARHAEEAGDEGTRGAIDPDRPRLRHGKPDNLTTESPRLTGLPPTMQQAVAVSDARSGTEHPWKYSWANAEDETKMKVALEAMARTALGMDAPVAPAAKKAAAGKTVAGKAVTGNAAKTAPVRKKTSMLAADVLPLEDEHFRVFELAYGSSATMVLTASSPKPAGADENAGAAAPAAGAKDSSSGDGPPVIKRGKPASSGKPLTEGPGATPVAKGAPQKFVTLIAQPDLYGGVLVLYKDVTDSAHLDEKPQMRLIDAVDAMGDNRGELLFELRGETQRSFGLFRVLRGSAEQLFATGPTATVVARAGME